MGFFKRLIVVLMSGGFISWLVTTDAYAKGEAVGRWLVIGAILLVGSLALLAIAWVINPSWPKELVSGNRGGAITAKHVVLVIVGFVVLCGAIALLKPA
jgi:hypothetical protein